MAKIKVFESRSNFKVKVTRSKILSFYAYHYYMSSTSFAIKIQTCDIYLNNYMFPIFHIKF